MQLVFLLFLVLRPFFADINPVFDEYDTRISIKQENGRLDNYAIQIKNSPGSRALIVVYAENEKTTRRAMKYLDNDRKLAT
jgi:hypothetical protein